MRSILSQQSIFIDPLWMFMWICSHSSGDRGSERSFSQALHASPSLGEGVLE